MQKAKFFLLYIYVENDDKLQIFLMRFTSNPESEHFFVTPLSDKEIWQCQEYNSSMLRKSDVFLLIWKHQLNTPNDYDTVIWGAK